LLCPLGTSILSEFKRGQQGYLGRGKGAGQWFLANFVLAAQICLDWLAVKLRVSQTNGLFGVSGQAGRA